MTATGFYKIFGFTPEASANAPGRVNLLGEHTDYNDGFVLPIAIPQRTFVELARSHDAGNHYYSEQKKEIISCSMDQPSPIGFAAYISGCIHLLQEKNFPVGPICLYINSQVPIGTGLSSSAALEVAVLRGLRTLFRIDISDVEIALTAQQAEIRYARVKCGIMDQMASSLADTEHMLFLDSRTLETKLLPIPQGSELLVIDSGVPRSLADSSYNQRREECEKAAALLGVTALRDVIDQAVTAGLPTPLNLRAHHVVSENNRVLEAINTTSATRFGELMNASHASLKEDFQVSIRPLDLLVELLQAESAVFGARLTGAGFGGACVALVRQGTARAVGADVVSRYRQHGYEGKVLVGNSR